jgi:GT2 family glycosyltransferase
MRRWVSSIKSTLGVRADRKRASERERWGAADADASRRAFDWDAAIVNYERYLEKRPRDLGIALRLARTLESAGRVEESEALLRRLVERRPDSRAARQHLAAVTGESGEFAPGFRMDHPQSRYQRFREGLSLPQAPEASGEVEVLIDGRGVSPVLVRASLIGLKAQTFADWNATVCVDPEALNHPLASLALVDDRIRFLSDPCEAAAASDGVRRLFLQAGAVLEPAALGWLVHAAIRTGASLTYGDHDRSADHWRWGRFWFDPALYPEPHIEDFITNRRPPVALLASGVALGSGAFEACTPVGRRQLLLEAGAQTTPTRVSLVLATLLGSIVTDDAFEAPAGAGPDSIEGDLASWRDLTALHDEQRILVVIPTRDEAASLKAMVDSLLARAERPARIDIVVVDNGSRQPEILAMIADWRTTGLVEVMTADEPFNWSRLNNLAAAGRNQDIFLFANNDMEMLTEGWDTRLAAGLAAPGVGASGARLLYPGGQIQHAGMALGALDDAPVHEGLGADRQNEGPLGRWKRNRPAAAVTGAFLAVHRRVFETVGGFETFGLAIACNDIDFCLRVRSLGLTIMYQADIELIHYESRTRGHADTDSKVAWASAEMATVHRTWGAGFIRDPSRSPAWKTRGTQVFHTVESPDRETVLLGLDEPDAWAVRRL